MNFHNIEHFMFSLSLLSIAIIIGKNLQIIADIKKDIDDVKLTLKLQQSALNQVQLRLAKYESTRFFNTDDDHEDDLYS